MVKKHLTELETQAAYEAFLQSEAFEAPNVSLITELHSVAFVKGSGPGPVSDYIDLSMRNITGGTLSARETANCYVISGTGMYEIPLVYGSAIMNGETNASAYTQAESEFTQPFYNYLNQQITSPFIETDTQAQAASAEVILVDDADYVIQNLSVVSNSLCSFLRFEVTSIPALGGNATIAVKDSNGVIMWSWHIWAYPFALGTFTHTNTNNVSYDFLDVNLGWVKSAADSKYGSSPYYQWGRKDPMLRNGAASGTFVTGNCATSLAATIQNPTTFNTSNGETINFNWWTDNGTAVSFYNYWDADSVSIGNADKVVNKTVYDPSPVGFSIPCGNAFLGFSKSNGGVWDSGWTWDDNYFAAAGYRNNGSGGILNVGSRGRCWLASSYSQQCAYYLRFDSSYVLPQHYDLRALGFSVRPARRPQNI